MPCDRSIPFPTAAIMPCDIGNSHPATISWKDKFIAATCPLTVDCRLLCTKHRGAVNPSRSDNTSLGSASVCNHDFFPCACLYFTHRCSTSLDSFSAYCSRLNRARAFQLIALPRRCVLPSLVSPVPAGARANSRHNRSEQWTQKKCMPYVD